jgi:hypothetical protein
VLPASAQNDTATLGTVVRHLRDGGHKWRFTLVDRDGASTVDPLLAMLDRLWTGQVSRHGGGQRSRDQTPAEAQAAVHLAATLVQLLSTGMELGGSAFASRVGVVGFVELEVAAADLGGGLGVQGGGELAYVGVVVAEDRELVAPAVGRAGVLVSKQRGGVGLGPTRSEFPPHSMTPPDPSCAVTAV